MRVTSRAVEGATTTVAATPAVLLGTLGSELVAVFVPAVVLAEVVLLAGVVRRS